MPYTERYRSSDSDNSSLDVLPGPPRPFKYDHLKDAESYIRLLEVHDFDQGDLIRCTLKSVKIDHALNLDYRALSYRWGKRKRTSKPRYTIRLNQRQFEVQGNLYEFIEHAARMRRKDRAGWRNGLYWIDAICINQKNEREKSKQLKHIRDIYRSAFQTYVWLGPDNRRMGPAFKYLEQFQDREFATETKDRNDEGEDNRKTSKHDTEDLHDLVQAITIVLESPYWTRVWILQEIAVSDYMRVVSPAPHRDRTYLICGRREIQWRVFNVLPLLVQLLQSDDHTIKALQNRIRKTQGVWLICCMYASNISWQHESKLSALAGLKLSHASSLSLSLLIHLSENSEASRGEDYMYAIVGLVEDSWEDHITPRKNRTGCQVICRAIKIMVDSAQQDGSEAAEHLEYLAKRAQHKPLKMGSEFRKFREKCCGPGCGSENCRHDHLQCNALNICRRMARYLHKGEVLLTMESKSEIGKVNIGRDFVEHQSEWSATTQNALVTSAILRGAFLKDR